MATRPIRYETHIRPLMRLIDRENMLWAFDLWKYEDVRDHAADILARIQVDMPPASYGGPWPEEWVTLFQRWKTEGFGRLELGAVDATGYVATYDGTEVTLIGRGTTPSSGYRAWLEGSVPEGSPREYTLYWEPPSPPQPTPTPTLFRAKAVFPASTTMTQVAVVDVAGRVLVPITSAAGPLVAAGTLAEVADELTNAGGALLGTAPLVGGSISRFRFDQAEVSVYWDYHSVELEGAPSLLDRLRSIVKGASG